MCVTGCRGGVGEGKLLGNGIGSGGGHGGKGGRVCYNSSCVEGGITYGDADLPCELGSGSGDYSPDYSSAGGGIVGMECQVFDDSGVLFNTRLGCVFIGLDVECMM